VKLLFDENLSPRLLDVLAADFPGSTHIEHLKMRGATDAAIWAYARDHGYTIVSKDNDFRQYAFLYGPPPKVLWLAIGNAGTDAIARLIASRAVEIRKFDADPEQSLLPLELKQ
jgi:predicted nuclease of predicted toxin-antitoxin system